MDNKILQYTEQEKRSEREDLKKLSQEQAKRWEKIKEEMEEIISKLEEDNAK